MSLLSCFAPVVEVIVNPDEFNFSTGGRSIAVATRLWVVAGPDGAKITAVGSGPSEPNAEPIDLFSEDPTFREAELRPELLAKFVAHGIVTALDRTMTLRPRVVFTNVASLEPFLTGYQQIVLGDAATHAGASKVDFQR